MKHIIKQISKQFLVLTVAIIFGGSLFSACSSSANSNRPNGQAATGSEKQSENVVNENKRVENKATTATPRNDLIEIFDGRIEERKEKTATSSEKQFVEAEFKRNETAIMQKSKFECDEGTEEGVEIIGVAEGAFTAPKSAQKAFLYERCRAGRAFGIGGIMIVEGEKVAAHYTYGENGLESGILSLPDVNKNGLSEIVLVGSGTGQGYTSGGIDLLEFKAGDINFLGNAETYSDNSGAVEGDKVETVAQKISVQPAAEPEFFREIYEKRGSAKAFSLNKKLEKFVLSKREPAKFVKIS
jgi:hypothetical protein